MSINTSNPIYQAYCGDEVEYAVPLGEEIGGYEPPW